MQTYKTAPKKYKKPTNWDAEAAVLGHSTSLDEPWVCEPYWKKSRNEKKL